MSRIDDRFLGGRISRLETEVGKKLELLPDCGVTVSINTGNDVTGDGSEQRPFKTIAKAFASLPKVHPGPVGVTIKPGVYVLDEPLSLSGRLFTGITLYGSSQDGGTQIKMKDNPDDDALLEFSSLPFRVTLRDMEFTAPSVWGSGTCVRAYYDVSSFCVRECKFKSLNAQDHTVGVKSYCAKTQVVNCHFNGFSVAMDIEEGFCVSTNNNGANNKYALGLDSAIGIHSGPLPSWSVSKALLKNGGQVFGA